ncbi:hypothetical protein [Microvirga calopogonii]|nr:hypothetical protein [Microvirga calopogonii]
MPLGVKVLKVTPKAVDLMLLQRGSAAEGADWPAALLGLGIV